MKSTAMGKLKFLQLKNRLKLPTYQVVGILETLWVFTAGNAPDGGVGRFPDAGIAAYLEWPGDPAELIRALVDEGWLDRRDDAARLSVHDWHEHCPNFIKANMKRHGKSFLAPPNAQAPPMHLGTIPEQHALGQTGHREQHAGREMPEQTPLGGQLEHHPRGACSGMVPSSLVKSSQVFFPQSPPAGGPQKNPSFALQEKPEQRQTRREAAAAAVLAEVGAMLPDALEAPVRAKWRDWVAHCAAKSNPVSIQMAGELIPELAKLPVAKAVADLAAWIAAGRWSPPAGWLQQTDPRENDSPPPSPQGAKRRPWREGNDWLCEDSVGRLWWDGKTWRPIRNQNQRS